MRFKKIIARNFMSFKKLEFPFPQTGLYFVGGEVVGKEISNSNGAGKSVAICETLSFGLYGRTIRNAEKDDIINWDVNKDCAVHVIVDDEKGNEYDVVRFRKDSEHENGLFLLKGDTDLTEGDAKRTQELIDSVVGMNFLVFSTAVVFGEKAQRFAEAQPAEKNQIFDEILMLHRFLEMQQAVKVDAKDLIAKEQEWNYEIGKAEEGLKVLDEQLESVNFRITELNKLKKEAGINIEEDRLRCRQKEKKLASASITLEKLKKAGVELESQNQKIFDFIEKTTEKKDAALEGLRGQVEPIKLNLDITSNDVNKIEDWLKHPEELKPDTRCMVCGQEITKISIRAVGVHYKKELVRLCNKRQRWQIKYNAAMKYYQKEDEVWQKKLDKAAVTKSDLDEALESQKETVQEGTVELAELSGLISTLKEKINAAEAKFEETKDQLRTEKLHIIEKLEGYKIVVKNAEKELAQIGEESKYLKFWIEGFGSKGIKSLLLDEILPALNNRVAFYAAALLDSSMRIVFDTEAMLKSGDMRDKFNVKIFREGNQQVDYKLCSSGEKRRIDVAILLGLQNLIFERAGSCSNIVIFDEVFDSLDIVGIERVVNLLNEEVKNKAILVISHSSEFKDYFDNVLMIKKKNGVSVLEE